jgi:hypothetical protein
MPRGEYDATKEWKGAGHRMAQSEQKQTGDPQQIALREPPGYQHPRSVMDLIVAAAPRALPVSQEIEHGPDQSQSRSLEFEEAWQDAIGYYDRRPEGRRYRNTYLGAGPQEPPPRGGWQADVPFERYLEI